MVRCTLTSIGTLVCGSPKDLRIEKTTRDERSSVMGSFSLAKGQKELLAFVSGVCRMKKGDHADDEHDATERTTFRPNHLDTF